MGWGKIVKKIGNVAKKVAPIAGAAAGMYFGGPAGASLGASLGGSLSGKKGGGGFDFLGGMLGGGGGGNDIYGGIGQVGGGLYNYYNNRTVDKGILEAQLKAGEQASQLLNPYYQTGTQANQRLSDRLMGGFNFNQADLYNDPGYQFAVEQGQRGLNTQAAKSGLLGSGRALKEATQYGQGMAEGQFNNVYNRNLNKFNIENAALQNLAGQGQTAGTRMGNLMLGMGANRADYRASRGEERSNLTGNLIGGAAPILGGIGDYLMGDQSQQQAQPSGFGSYFAKNVPKTGAFGNYFAKSADMPLRTGARRPMTGFGRQNAAQNMRLSKGMGGSNWKVIG
jgi:hypothetical protein